MRRCPGAVNRARILVGIMMKRALGAFAGVAVLGAAVSAASHFSAAPASSARGAAPQLFSPPRELTLYGHIRSLTRKGARYELRFDPAWWLGGVTANRAAIEDRVIPPGDVVPNDYYVRDETHRLLTYRVPATARATVITFGGPPGLRSTAIPVSELAQIVKGRNPKRRRLYGPGNRLGFWIRVATDTVRALDQQYQP
jgi:hypothetical protein